MVKDYTFQTLPFTSKIPQNTTNKHKKHLRNGKNKASGTLEAEQCLVSFWVSLLPPKYPDRMLQKQQEAQRKKSPRKVCTPRQGRKLFGAIAILSQGNTSRKNTPSSHLFLTCGFSRTSW